MFDSALGFGLEKGNEDCIWCFIHEIEKTKSDESRKRLRRIMEDESKH
jgi:hypothetical protein